MSLRTVTKSYDKVTLMMHGHFHNYVTQIGGAYQGCYQDAEARIWPLDGSDPGMEIADWGNTPAR